MSKLTPWWYATAVDTFPSSKVKWKEHRDLLKFENYGTIDTLYHVLKIKKVSI